MKKIRVLFTVAGLISSIFFIAQKDKVYPTCGVKKLSLVEENNFVNSLNKIAEYKNKNSAKSIKAETYIIPVVFHILNTGGNITKNFTKIQMKKRIDDALDICNKDFNGLYPAFNTVSPLFEGVKSKMNIKFVAATIDPNGNLLEMPGMNWQADAHIESGYDPRIYNYMYYGKNNKYYLDIVVVNQPNSGDGNLGSAHAFLPIQDVVPHVTFNHRYVGSIEGSDASFQFAKVVSHELGHYFGLLHTFDGKVDCDPINDGMADTPPTTSGFGCNLSQVNSCGVIANYENLMDYNSNCQSMFTKDQTTTMNFWLEDITAKYPRKYLWQQSNLIATGVVPSKPIANIKYSTSTICANKSINFTDTSLGLPTSRTWSFPGGVPSSSTLANPSVVYSTPGTYSVTLTSKNEIGSDTKTITALVKVGQTTNTNYIETFSGVFPPQGWLVTNPDDFIEWEKNNEIGLGDTKCMIINNADNFTVGQLDYIQLPYFNFTSGVNSQMIFDVAYAKFDDVSPDVLDVEVSTDCGTTWTSIYSKTHTELETQNVQSNLSNYWKPSASNWRKEVINLSSFIGSPNVTFRFKNKSGYGCRIWIDNVNIIINQKLTPTTEFSANNKTTNCSSLTVNYKDNSIGNPTSWSWSFPGGVPATSTLQNPTVIYSKFGLYSATLITSNSSGAGNSVTKSNFINLIAPTNSNFKEGFERSTIPNSWIINNFDNDNSWEITNKVGKSSTSSLTINNADNFIVGNIDELILGSVDMSKGVTDFSFDVAYAKFDNLSADILDVMISTDCGTTWTKLYSKKLSDLATFDVIDNPNTEENEINNWVPSIDSHWRTERILLNSYKNQPNVLIKFVNTCGYGSKIWIDNINFNFDSKEKPFSDFQNSNQNCKKYPIQFNDISTGEPTSWQWSFPGGTPSTSNLKNPTVTYNSSGEFNVTLISTNIYGTGNTTTKSNLIKIKEENILPFAENFNGVFPIKDWEIINTDFDKITWEKRSDVGNGDLSSMVINNADNPLNLVDEIILKPFNFSSTSTPYLHFDLAYTQYLNANDPAPAPDKMEILVSSDCGSNWTSVYSKNQLQLQTVNPPIQDNPSTLFANETNDWIPRKSTDWRKESVNLSTVANQSNVLIKFRNTSGYGTRIWFDNFNVTKSAVLSSESVNNVIENVMVIPNPSLGVFEIQVPENEETYKVFVHNLVGQLVFETTFEGGNLSPKVIDLSGKEKGIYSLRLESASKKTTSKKLIKL